MPRSLIRRSKYLVCWGVLFAVAACTDSSELNKNGSARQAQSDPVQVQTTRLRLQDWHGSITTFGSVEAAEEIQLSLDFPATVDEVLVDEGEPVEVGQLLISMEQEKPQLRSQQANEFALRSKAALDDAYLDLQRRRRLAEMETVSKEILDKAKLAVKSSEAAYRQSLAAKRLAEKELAESRITSPVVGVVDVRAVEKGQSVPAGSNLMTIQATRALQVKTWVSEKDVGLVGNGASARIELSSRPTNIFNGKVKSVGISAHPATGNFPVEVVIEDGDQLARPGMTAKVEIQGLTTPKVLLLPEAALVDRNRRRVVYVLQDDGFAREVEPLLNVGLSDQIVILSGLKAGDQLIVSNLEQVIDGSRVVARP
ncbi:MAG: efflux RND transporter periplasmic adaptor subunit [Gammaproteobacteria bacterium]|jgi:RND family efflux transporter MFP subunit|nr:efflux RND transporter periplasmic adaptor subunit [Gammaproteobacteria bacterium]MBT4492959.1 efflux RND transporter periplasmic adaptor subunit [Gammaproteobacteria bacterium]MBT7370425.1 efflux RND transporter periplasmic adaptor subunit [Gammaproteobacteria bacterium]